MGILDIFKRDYQAEQKPQRRSKRSYKAASSGRLFADFTSSSNSADSELRYSLELMRNRSRELVRDNEFARRYINLLKTNIIGESGFHLQVKARNDDGSLDAAGNNIIENAFKSWGRLGNPTVDGRLSWLDCQRYAIEALARDGEVFIKKMSGRNFRDNFALQFIEADLVDHKKNETLANGNQIRMGVELDRYHRPVAYWILQSHPGDRFEYSAGSQKHIRVPADDIIHVYMPTRTHQTRGEPFMSSVITSLKMMAGYRDAEITAARIGASKMGILTTPTGDDFVGNDLEDDIVPVIDVEPGTFHQLPAGYNLDMFDPNHPNTGFAEFESALLRGIASGLNVSYASLSNDLSSVNYSSIRQGALDERDGYRMLHQFMIQHFIDPVFREWLMSAMDFGGIPIPSSKFDKFADNASFRGRGWQWVDPVKEINAAVVGLNNGIMSMQDVAGHYGRDVEETFNQIARDKEIADQFGIKTAFEPFGNKFPTDAIVEGGDDGDL